MMKIPVHILVLPIVVAGAFGPGLEQIPVVSVFLYLPMLLSYARATMISVGWAKFLRQV